MNQLLGRAIVDVISRKEEKLPYSRNTGNTVLTVLLTIAIVVVMYARAWYPSLNGWSLHLQSDQLVRMTPFDLSF